MANNGTKDSDYVVGLDIGTSKVVCIIGKYVDQHSLEVISMGSYPSSGLKKGVVVNIDATTDAIQKSIDQAQASFEGKIKNLIIILQTLFQGVLRLWPNVKKLRILN